MLLDYRRDDNNSLSYCGSRHLAKLYAQKYGNPFKQ